MSYPPNICNQLKNKSPNDFMKVLLDDGWIPEETQGAVQSFCNPKTGQRVTIHFRPGKVYGRGLIQSMIDDIG